jgi:AcrB/AcrD/AcrF family
MSLPGWALVRVGWVGLHDHIVGPRVAPCNGVITLYRSGMICVVLQLCSCSGTIACNRTAGAIACRRRCRARVSPSANALAVIRNVKDRLAEIAPSLPQGVSIDAVYDRSDLIYRAINTLKRTLAEESLF